MSEKLSLISFWNNSNTTQQNLQYRFTLWVSSKTVIAPAAAMDIGTMITTIHDGFQKQESIDNHISGWDSYISGFLEFPK